MLVFIYMFVFDPDSKADWLLAAVQIDIWRFRLDKDASLLSNCLNEQEIQRANRFHFPKHQQRFRVARAIMRHILSRYLNIDAKEVTFQYDKVGKPSLKANLPLTFNLSHTGDYACLGVGLETAIGIDIEQFSARDYIGIGQHVFSVEEQKHLSAVPHSLLPMAFFSLWSQKEAVIKCNGLGMRYPLKQLTLPLFSPPGHQFIDIIDKQQRQIQRFTPYLGTEAALCCHPTVTDIRTFEWEN